MLTASAAEPPLKIVSAPILLQIELSEETAPLLPPFATFGGIGMGRGGDERSTRRNCAHARTLDRTKRTFSNAFDRAAGIEVAVCKHVSKQ